jgi:folate-dependent phosphoribosylglycinamide formyltransferase PurN
MSYDEDYLRKIKSIDNSRDILKEIVEMYDNGWVCTDGYYKDLTEPVLERAKEILLNRRMNKKE